MSKAKTWLITGTSSGLGRELMELALHQGDRVAATVRKTGELDELKKQYGERLWVGELDVIDAVAVRACVDRAFSKFGRIDIVVSNAGYGLFGAAEEVTDGQIRLQIETNLIGSIAVIRAVLPHLREQGGGRIVQVSSEGGQVAYPNFSIYHATKWGIEGFVEAVAQEVAPFGIGFTIVEPGPTSTNFGASRVVAPPLAVYDATPSGDIRRAIDSGSFAIRGSAASTARAMYEVALRESAPRRLTLGRVAFDHVRSALTRRLTELESQKEIALSIDAP